MRQWVAAILAAAALTGAISMMPALAGETNAVDCGSTPFVFSGDGYLVDCERHDNQARKDGGSGQSQLDVISVTTEDRSLFLTMISVRLTSTSLLMRYRSLHENALYFFSIDTKDWNGIGNKRGYDTAEFTADISGQPSYCVAVQRYMNPSAGGGYKRQVVGLGCAAGGLDPVYAALAKMRAPGD